MIVDGRGVANESIRNADVCVIGAGPAGLFLADRLARLSRLEIAVLESGGVAFDPEIQELSQGEVEGQTYFPLNETRIRAFGGTSWSWGGLLARLDPIDYEQRPWVPDSGWPISEADLARHLDDALDSCGFERPAKPLPEGSSEFVSPPLRYRGPIRFGKEFASRFEKADRISVYLRSTVRELIVSESGAAVSAARVVSDRGTTWTLSARLFVLASGGIENPRLLLASNRVDSKGLGNSHDLVGRYFMEHPKITDRVYLPREGRSQATLPGTAADDVHFTRLGITQDFQRRDGLLNYCANVSFGFVGQDGPQWEPLRRLVLAARPPWNESPYFQFAGGGPMGFRIEDLRTVLRHPLKSLMSVGASGLRPPMFRRFVSIESSLEQPPRPENRVILDARRDQFGAPLARVQWTLDESVRLTYERAFLRLLRHLERQIPGLSEQRMVRGEWPGDVRGAWHHMGTTRMHPDPARGVVDINCRLHDVANVYVAGSSVFPTGGATAPTLTIIALALRLAEHLAQTH